MKLYPFHGFKITATWKDLQKSRIISISFDLNVQSLNITGYYKESTCNFIYFRFSRWIVQKTDQLQLNPLTKKDKRKQEKERERRIEFCQNADARFTRQIRIFGEIDPRQFQMNVDSDISTAPTRWWSARRYRCKQCPNCTQNLTAVYRKEREIYRAIVPF